MSIYFNCINIYIFLRYTGSLFGRYHNNTKLVVSWYFNIRPRHIIVNNGSRYIVITRIRWLHYVRNILSYYGHSSKVSIADFNVLNNELNNNNE